MKSMTVMALQRPAILVASWVALLPVMVTLIADGWVARRIRSAEMKAATPTFWKLSLITAVLMPLFAVTGILFPSFPTAVLQGLPIIHAVILRQCAACRHRFI